VSFAYAPAAPPPERWPGVRRPVEAGQVTGLPHSYPRAHVEAWRARGEVPPELPADVENVGPKPPAPRPAFRPSTEPCARCGGGSRRNRAFRTTDPSLLVYCSRCVKTAQSALKRWGMRDRTADDLRVWLETHEFRAASAKPQNPKPQPAAKPEVKTMPAKNPCARCGRENHRPQPGRIAPELLPYCGACVASAKKTADQQSQDRNDLAFLVGWLETSKPRPFRKKKPNKGGRPKSRKRRASTPKPAAPARPSKSDLPMPDLGEPDEAPARREVPTEVPGAALPAAARHVVLPAARPTSPAEVTAPGSAEAFTTEGLRDLAAELAERFAAVREAENAVAAVQAELEELVRRRDAVAAEAREFATSFGVALGGWEVAA